MNVIIVVKPLHITVFSNTIERIMPKKPNKCNHCGEAFENHNSLQNIEGIICEGNSMKVFHIVRSVHISVVFIIMEVFIL